MLSVGIESNNVTGASLQCEFNAGLERSALPQIDGVRNDDSAGGERNLSRRVVRAVIDDDNGIPPPHKVRNDGANNRSLVERRNNGANRAGIEVFGASSSHCPAYPARTMIPTTRPIPTTASSEIGSKRDKTGAKRSVQIYLAEGKPRWPSWGLGIAKHAAHRIKEIDWQPNAICCGRGRRRSRSEQTAYLKPDQSKRHEFPRMIGRGQFKSQ